MRFNELFDDAIGKMPYDGQYDKDIFMLGDMKLGRIWVASNNNNKKTISFYEINENSLDRKYAVELNDDGTLNIVSSAKGKEVLKSNVPDEFTIFVAPAAPRIGYTPRPRPNFTRNGGKKRTRKTSKKRKSNRRKRV